jgi:hypothetical protein
MDETKFRETEEKYRELKGKHSKGLMSTEQLKEAFKKLMVQDESGTYWMLGGKSGKWYRHDGSQWQEADPYEMFAEEEEAFLELDDSVKLSDDEYEMISDDSASSAFTDIASSTQQEEKVEEEVDKPGNVTDNQMVGESSGEASSVIEDSTYNAFDTYGTYEIDTTSAEESVNTVDEEISFERQKVEDEAQTADQEVKADVLADSDDATEVMDTKKYEYTLHKGETAAAASPAVPAAPAVSVPGSTASGEESPEVITCGICKSRIPPYAVYCTFCGAHQKSLKERSSLKAAKEESELLIKSIKFTSLLFFLGGLGLIIGVICGAIFGVIKDFFSSLSTPLPMMLSEVRGGWAGGLIFAAIGGIGSFILSALLGVILSGIYNFIAFIFGGIRFKVKR